jgi:hypothetical protein
MRIFTETGDTEELLYRQVSDDNRIEMGVGPVMFGFRVRAGFTGDDGFYIDYCAGADVEFLKTLYALVLLGLQKHRFADFPKQEMKPFYNDPVHFAELIKLTGATSDEIEDLRRLHNFPDLKKRHAAWYANKLG